MMAMYGRSKDDRVKVQFTTREGIYKRMPTLEKIGPKQLGYTPEVPASSSTPVKSSFVVVNNGENIEECICLNIGRELYYFTYKSIQQSKPVEFLNKRVYKGVVPMCHSINQFTASEESVRVAVGFTAGQVQIIDVCTKESLHIMNEDRSVEKSRVTCVDWYPNSADIILSAHQSGMMYTYDITQLCTNLTTSYHTQAHKTGDGYSIFTLKTKNITATSPASTTGVVNTCNPLFKWVMTNNGLAVHLFKFSPCGKYVAIVTQSGYLRILCLTTFEQYGCMKSYFGGLLTCDWSPDGRYIVTGGEDDLVTVWSFCDKTVVARGSGHRSWISDVQFDPFFCSIPSDSDMENYYGILSISEIFLQSKPDLINKEGSTKSSENLSDVGGDTSDNTPTMPARCKQSSPDVSMTSYDDETSSSASLRRLETYNDISNLPASTGVGSRPPSICYRFGSVGQDAQLCLWELDENSLSLLRRNKTWSLTGPGHHDRGSNKLLTKNASTHTLTSEVLTETSMNSQVVNEDSKGSGDAKPQNILHNAVDQRLTGEVTSKHLVNSTVNSSKDNKQAHKSESSGGLSAIRKFATIGSHDHSQKHRKEHKRNLSLPHFGVKNAHGNSGTSSKTGSSKKGSLPKEAKTFGTDLCPHLEDTTMLEPIICKKVAQGRITCISFKEDCILTTCQDGYIQLWLRPKAVVKPNMTNREGASE